MAYTVSGGCVDWQAVAETVFNIRVFVLASLQQLRNIKQRLSDAGCALVACCFAVCSSDEYWFSVELGDCGMFSV